jgi:hypothetical protein
MEAQFEPAQEMNWLSPWGKPVSKYELPGIGE